MQAMRRLARNRLAVAGLGFIAVLTLIALLAPLVAPHDPAAQNLGAGEQFAGPSWSHLMGTDALGRDWLSRLVYGARVSLVVGIAAQAVVLGIGLPLGLLSGFKGGWVDSVIMRMTDLSYAFPELILLVLLRSVVGGSLAMVILIVGLVGWMNIARLVRGQVLSLREQDFVQAARALGATDREIMTRHLLPNLAGPVAVMLALGIPAAIFFEASLSFIGYGVSATAPSWGSMVNQGYAAPNAPHLMLFPAAAIALLLLAFTVAGDGLRDALDPRTDTRRRLAEAEAGAEPATARAQGLDRAA
jgi:oligopeptide transport system permease protein